MNISFWPTVKSKKINGLFKRSPLNIYLSHAQLSLSRSNLDWWAGCEDGTPSGFLEVYINEIGINKYENLVVYKKGIFYGNKKAWNVLNIRFKTFK